MVWVDLLLFSCRSFSSGLLGFLLAEELMADAFDPHDRLHLTHGDEEGFAFFLPLDASPNSLANDDGTGCGGCGFPGMILDGRESGLANLLCRLHEALFGLLAAGGAGLLRLLSLSVHVVFVLVELAIHLTAIVLLVVLVVHNSSYFIVKLIVNIYTLSCRKLIRYNNL